MGNQNEDQEEKQDSYIYLDSEMPVEIDCDETLLMWVDEMKPGEGKIECICPFDGERYYLTPHTRHINFLKKLSKRGYMVTVWSANGAAWAKMTVDTLGIGKYVDVVRGKPLKYIDDLQAHEILGTRIYMEYEEHRKE